MASARTLDPIDYAQNVLTVPAKASIFLTVTIREGAEDATRDMLTDVPALIRSVAFRVPENELSCVVGIGSDFWDRAYRDLPKPADLHPFAAINGDTHQAPSTPGDLLFHLRCQRFDMCFELAKRLLIALGDAVDSADEVHGFRYFDERDLLGFVDGTENPGGRAAVNAVLMADGDYAGSSYVIVQKYLHNLKAWSELSTEDQEKAIGRSKLSDIEMADDVKPSNSHVALNTIEDANGVQRQIVRDNLPFGSASAGEFGTYFIGYAADPSVTELMLQRMFIGVPEGNHDRILDFSTAITGCLFFVPPADFLEHPERFANTSDAEPEAASPSPGSPAHPAP